MLAILLIVSAPFVLGASYFMRQYKFTKQSIYRTACYWGRFASGSYMVIGGMYLVSLGAVLIDTIVKTISYAKKFDISDLGIDLKDILSFDLDNEIFQGIIITIAMIVALYFGHKNLIAYNEMFLYEYHEAQIAEINTAKSKDVSSNKGFFCVECGTKCLPDSTFCTNCGRKQ